MNDDSTTDLLLKADALMRRGRSYVAAQPPPVAPTEPTPPTDPSPTLESPAPQSPTVDDDIPVLTDRVADEEAAFATAPPHMQAQLDALRQELARWLEQELPHAVLTVTDGLADQLMGELTHQAEKKLLPRLIARLDGRTSEAG